MRYNHGNKLKLFRNHLHLKQVSKARKVKNDLIQEFKKENPTKDVGKLPVIKRYNRYQQIGYYDSEDNTDGELSADSSQRSSTYLTIRMFIRIDTSDDEDSIDNNIIIQRSNNTEYDSDESSELPKLQTRTTWESISSNDSDEYTSDSDSDEDEKNLHQKYNIKKTV